MIALVLGLVVASFALGFVVSTVWVRWKIRDRRRRLERLQARMRCRDELERAVRRLRLRIRRRSPDVGVGSVDHTSLGPEPTPTRELVEGR